MAAWPSVADCERWLDPTTALAGDDLTDLTEACYAARAWVQARCWSVEVNGQVDDSIVQAVKMKAVRLYRKKDSPENGSDFTVVPEVGGTAFDTTDREIWDLIRPFLTMPIGSAGACDYYSPTGY